MEFSDDEWTMLNNCLNEICNGVHIDDWELHSRIGFGRLELRALLNKMNARSQSDNASGV